ncbi:hypothetical protein ACQ3I4_09065 [Zafaria sp. Z1313]
MPDTPAGPRADAELVDGVDCSSASEVLSPPDPSAPRPPAAGAIPAGFVPVELIRCSFLMDGYEDEQGLWSAVGEEHLAGDLDALAIALDEPDDGPRMDMACTADLEIVPDLWLVDASGRAMRAAWPVNSCGKTKPGVHDVLAGMEVASTKRIPVTLIEPRAALDAGCPATWSITAANGLVRLAPEVPVRIDGGAGAKSDGGTGGGVAADPGVVPGSGEADALRICHYRADAEEDRDSTRPPNGGAETPFEIVELVSGTFASGGHLEGPAVEALLRAAERPANTAAPACEERATEFAVLWPLAGGEVVGAPLTLEINGCRRLFDPLSLPRTLPDDVHDAVARALDD